MVTFFDLSILFSKRRLSRSIKSNEGYSEKVYLDQLGNRTIGYGHLITKKENFENNRKYPKQLLTKIFNEDMNKAVKIYNKLFHKHKFSDATEEVIIEMIFQLGEKKFLKFGKTIKALKDKKFIIASREILNSKMYKQVPRRVRSYAEILIKQA